MIVDNNEEITTGNDGTEMCSSGADVAVEMCSPESHDTCGDCGYWISHFKVLKYHYDCAILDGNKS